MGEVVGKLLSKGNLYEHRFEVKEPITINDFVMAHHKIMGEDILCKVTDLISNGNGIEGTIKPMKQITYPLQDGTPLEKASIEQITAFLGMADKNKSLHLGRLKGFDVQVWFPINALLKHMSILGTTGSGKTYTGTVMIEELAAMDITSVVFDVRGDFLRVKDEFPSKINVVELRRHRWYNNLHVERDKTTLIDMRDSDDMNMVYSILEGIWNERNPNNPLVLVIDEAHNFCPQVRSKHKRLSDLVKTIACEGRGNGIGLVVITQRPAKISKDLLSQCMSTITLGIREENDLKKVIANAPGLSKADAGTLQNLEVGQAVVYGGNIRIPLVVEIRKKYSPDNESVTLI